MSRRGDESARDARERARQARRRADLDRRQREQEPPPAPDDWTVAEGPDLRRVRPPVPVGDELAHLVRRRGWDQRLRGTVVWSRWAEVVGSELAGRCEPVRLAGGRLVIRAESQVWATQLRYLGAQLTANAEGVLGPGTVTSVQVVVGPLESRHDAGS